VIRAVLDKGHAAAHRFPVSRKADRDLKEYFIVRRCELAPAPPYESGAPVYPRGNKRRLKLADVCLPVPRLFRQAGVWPGAFVLYLPLSALGGLKRRVAISPQACGEKSNHVAKTGVVNFPGRGIVSFRLEPGLFAPCDMSRLRQG